MKQLGRYYGRIASYLDQHYVRDHRRNELGEARAGVGSRETQFGHSREDSNLSVVLTAIKKGATLCGHEVDRPVTVQVLSGAIQYGVLGESRSLVAGTVTALDKGIPHDNQALQDSELLLTIAKKVK